MRNHDQKAADPMGRRRRLRMARYFYDVINGHGLERDEEGRTGIGK